MTDTNTVPAGDGTDTILQTAGPPDPLPGDLTPSGTSVPTDLSGSPTVLSDDTLSGTAGPPDPLPDDSGKTVTPSS